MIEYDIQYNISLPIPILSILYCLVMGALKISKTLVRYVWDRTCRSTSTPAVR